MIPFLIKSDNVNNELTRKTHDSHFENDNRTKRRKTTTATKKIRNALNILIILLVNADSYIEEVSSVEGKTISLFNNQDVRSALFLNGNSFSI